MRRHMDTSSQLPVRVVMLLIAAMIVVAVGMSSPGCSLRVALTRIGGRSVAAIAQLDRAHSPTKVKRDFMPVSPPAPTAPCLLGRAGGPWGGRHAQRRLRPRAARRDVIDDSHGAGIRTDGRADVVRDSPRQGAAPSRVVDAVAWKQAVDPITVAGAVSDLSQ